MRSSPDLALVTGASAGIGWELATVLATRGYDLVLAADEEFPPQIDELTAEGTAVLTVRGDLRLPAAVEELHAAVQETGRPLAVAALNTGIGRGGGTFVATPLEDHLDVIRLNVLSTVHLAKLVLTDMLAAGSGRMLITSSLVAGMPGPYQATYNASKSFVSSFTAALQYELRDLPVAVTSLLPGATDTGFFRRAGMATTVLGRMPKNDPAGVAGRAVEALLRGRRTVIGGFGLNRLTAGLNTVLPDTVKARVQAFLSRPRGSG